MTSSTPSKSPKRSREDKVTEKVARAKSVVRLSDEKYEVVCNKVKNILLDMNALLPKNIWKDYQTSDLDNRPPRNLFAQFPFHEQQEIKDMDGPPSFEKIPLLAEKLQTEPQLWDYEVCHVTSDALSQALIFQLGCYHGHTFRLILEESYSPNEFGEYSTWMEHDCRIIMEMTIGMGQKVRFLIDMENSEFPDTFTLSIRFHTRPMSYKEKRQYEETVWANYGKSIQEVLLSLLRQQDDDGPFLQLSYLNCNFPVLSEQFSEVGLQI